MGAGVTSFLCNELGHQCDGAAPATRAPTGMVTDVVTYSSCVANDFVASLTPVATFVAAIKGLKRDPAGQILVTSIQGPAAPYSVHWRQSGVSASELSAYVAHSCTASNGSFGDPGVRLQSFIDRFGTNGMQFSICDDSFALALTALATRIGELIGP